MVRESLKDKFQITISYGMSALRSELETVLVSLRLLLMRSTSSSCLAASRSSLLPPLALMTAAGVSG
jgi:hypothetical protein